jgi:hypothetical protein
MLQEAVEDLGEPEPTKHEFVLRKRQNPFAQIDNAMLRDERLSYEARGALAMVLSYPSDWQFNMSWFCKKGGIGRDRARRIVRELEKHGYCRREQFRNANNEFGAVVRVFTDDPGICNEPLTAFPSTGEPSPGNPPTTNTKRKNIQRDEDKRSIENQIDDATRQPAVVNRYVTEAALDKVREIAPGWDRQFLLRKFDDWPASKNARNKDAAFLAWVKRFTKGKPPA